MTIIEADDIPILPKEPTLKQVNRYLRWLWDSQYRYHLDDDPVDICWGDVPGILDSEIAILQQNHNIMWRNCLSGQSLWNQYAPHNA